jgi:hypothetical protein
MIIKKQKYLCSPNIIKHSTTTYIIFFHTIVLVFVSLLPAVYNMGVIYLGWSYSWWKLLHLDKLITDYKKIKGCGYEQLFCFIYSIRSFASSNNNRWNNCFINKLITKTNYYKPHIPLINFQFF